MVRRRKPSPPLTVGLRSGPYIASPKILRQKRVVERVPRHGGGKYRATCQKPDRQRGPDPLLSPL
jgi:hypothetical protein